MHPEVFLHIGYPKTGTTAIQSFFEANRKILVKHGVLYPESGCRNGTHFDLSDSLGFKLGIRYKSDQKAVEKLRHKLLKEVDNHNPDTILLSSENFVLAGDPSELKKLLPEFNFRIVVYLRRHDKWWESKFWQATRMASNPRWGRGIENYISFLKNQKNLGSFYINYRVIVDRWAEVFGNENIVVRPYESAQMPKGSVDDIFDVLGKSELVESELSTPTSNVNSSKSFLSLQLMEVYQRLQLPDSTRKKLVDHALALPDLRGHGFLSSPELRKQLIDENFDDYQYLAKKYLRRENGQLFYEAMPEADGNWSTAAPLLNMRVIQETISAIIA